MPKRVTKSWRRIFADEPQTQLDEREPVALRLGQQPARRFPKSSISTRNTAGRYFHGSG
jgi:hypothetical protein